MIEANKPPSTLNDSAVVMPMHVCHSCITIFGKFLVYLVKRVFSM